MYTKTCYQVIGCLLILLMFMPRIYETFDKVAKLRFCIHLVFMIFCS